GNNLNVTCTAVANQNISGNYVIQTILLDRYTYLPSSPNGQPNHYHAMLDMAPTSSGQAFSAVAYDTVHYYATCVLNPSWDLENLDLSCFVQNNTTKEVIQSRCEQVPVDFPSLYYISNVLEDNGNNDGRAEPGETAYMTITLGNLEAFQTATNVVGTLSTTDPDLNITTAVQSFPDIPNGGSGSNARPFVFEVSTAAVPHPSSLHLVVVADPQQTTMEVDIPIYIGWPDVLLVDDDGTSVFETYYESTLQNLNIGYEYWDVNTQGVPPAGVANGYPVIIWLTGYVTVDVLSAEERTLIEGYLSGGGNLFITGQNIAQGLNTSAPTFLHDVLHANFNTANTTIKILNGVAGNPVGDGMVVNCNTGGSGSGNCTSPDGITVLAPASEAFIYSASSHRGGLTYEGTNAEKLVYFSYPFEAISGQSSSNTREQVLQAIMDFFGPLVPEVQITLTPTSPPIVIPATGGSFSYTIEVTNNDVVAREATIWCNLTKPNGVIYGPVLGPVTITMSPSLVVNRVRNQNIPDWAPAGVYSFNGYVASQGDTATANFPFEKLATGNGIVYNGWANTGEEFDPWLTQQGTVLPEVCLLEGAFPNPFNPTSAIRFQIPESAPVQLAIYDISGSLVATLVDGWRTAGSYEATFDGTNLASGVYICRLNAGAVTTSMKLLLLK
ncbi:MAG: T9SS type A sorting domain-containing protein, partial [bacterium]